jgi:hypothetical protein
MPQAALPFQCTINDAARPGLLKSPGISGHPNAAPEWQAGSSGGGAESWWWPVHSRGVFEVSTPYRQRSQTFASPAGSPTITDRSKELFVFHLTIDMEVTQYVANRQPVLVLTVACCSWDWPMTSSCDITSGMHHRSLPLPSSLSLELAADISLVGHA